MEFILWQPLFLFQNKLLDTRFKETVERLEADRSTLEEKVRELQSEVCILSNFKGISILLRVSCLVSIFVSSISQEYF